MLYVLLDNVPSINFDMCVAVRPEIPTPKRKIETYEVPGRHGALTKLGAFEDISLPVVFNILENENVKQKIRNFKGYLLNKKTLRFSDDDVFYTLKNFEVGSIDNQIAEYGYFTVTFLLGPFQYALSEKEEFTKADTIFNYGTFESNPEITVYGNGDINLIINEQKFVMKGIKDFIVLDSEMKLAYKGSENVTNLTNGEFLTLKVGKNTISWTGNVKKIEINPRWRYI